MSTQYILTINRDVDCASTPYYRSIHRAIMLLQNQITVWFSSKLGFGNSIQNSFLLGFMAAYLGEEERNWISEIGGLYRDSFSLESHCIGSTLSK